MKLTLSRRPVTGETVHHVKTIGPPIFVKTRHQALDKLKIAKAEFDHFLDLGIVRISDSSWASPMHMAPKTNPEDWHSCGEYFALNNVTIPDRYLIPHIHDFASPWLHGIMVFSKIGLLVAAKDAPKTAIITPFGKFVFLRMSFGLCASSELSH